MPQTCGDCAGSRYLCGPVARQAGREVKRTKEAMALVKSVRGLVPRWGRDCYFSENATIVGEVIMGDECSVWFNAVVRGDVARVRMGNRVNVQDGACVHVTNTVGPVEIEDDVTIGHNATVHACTIRKGALVGMGATVLDRADIGPGAIVAAGALVLEGTRVGEREIWGGVPARFLKKASPDQAEGFARHYVEYSKWYLEEGER